MTGLQKILTDIRSIFPLGPIRIPLDSEALRSASYERHNRILRLEFRNGGIYEYGSVEPSKFRQLLHAASAGRFFVKEIRNSYPFRKIS